MNCLQQQVKAGWVTEDKVNDSVLRILTPMFAMGIFDLPNNGTTATNATTEVCMDVLSLLSHWNDNTFLACWQWNCPVLHVYAPHHCH